jgi:hypothetical protein
MQKGSATAQDRGYHYPGGMEKTSLRQAAREATTGSHTNLECIPWVSNSQAEQTT